MPDDGISINITGLKELDDTLRSMATEQAQKIIRKALRDGAAPMRDAIAEAAPERVELPSGTALPVGALQNDITIKAGFDDDNLPAVWIGPGKATKHVAEWVEYGHRLVRGGQSRIDKKTGKKRGNGKEVGTVDPHPFIRTTYEANAQKMIDDTVQSLITQIESSVEKNG